MQYMSNLKKLIIKSYNLNNNCNFVYVMYSKEVMYKYENNYWRYLEELYSQSKVVIDRPKGSVHPRYPQIVYELDYGYLDGTKSSDNEGIDVWLGTNAEQKLDAIVCTVDLVKRDSEIKLLIGCTPVEKLYIKSFYNEWPQMGGLLIER